MQPYQYHVPWALGQCLGGNWSTTDAALADLPENNSSSNIVLLFSLNHKHSSELPFFKNYAKIIQLWPSLNIHALATCHIITKSIQSCAGEWVQNVYIDPYVTHMGQKGLECVHISTIFQHKMDMCPAFQLVTHASLHKSTLQHMDPCNDSSADIFTQICILIMWIKNKHHMDQNQSVCKMNKHDGPHRPTCY